MLKWKDMIKRDDGRELPNNNQQKQHTEYTWERAVASEWKRVCAQEVRE